MNKVSALYKTTLSTLPTASSFTFSKLSSYLYNGPIAWNVSGAGGGDLPGPGEERVAGAPPLMHQGAVLHRGQMGPRREVLQVSMGL